MRSKEYNKQIEEIVDGEGVIGEKINEILAASDEDRKKTESAIAELKEDISDSNKKLDAFAEQGNEYEYSNTHTHLDFAKTRMNQLRQQLDDIDSGRLITKEQYEKLYKAIIGEYNSSGRKLADVFLDCIKKLRRAGADMDHVSANTDYQLTRLQKMYWEDGSMGYDRKPRKQTPSGSLSSLGRTQMQKAIDKLDPHDAQSITAWAIEEAKRFCPDKENKK